MLALAWRRHSSSFTKPNGPPPVRSGSTFTPIMQQLMTHLMRNVQQETRLQILWIRTCRNVWLESAEACPCDLKTRLFYIRVQNDTQTRAGLPSPGPTGPTLECRPAPLLKHGRAFTPPSETASCCRTQAAEGVREDADITPWCVDLWGGAQETAGTRVAARKKTGIRSILWWGVQSLTGPAEKPKIQTWIPQQHIRADRRAGYKHVDDKYLQSERTTETSLLQTDVMHEQRDFRHVNILFYTKTLNHLWVDKNVT